jgi:hypothetical protein
VRQEQTARQHGREKCGVWFGAMVDSIGPVVETVSGRVVAIRQGFYTGVPGSLMRLETMDAEGTVPKETYLFYPFARIETAEALICAKPLRDSEPPQVGDYLLIHARGKSVAHTGRRILWVDERDVVTQ